MQLAAATLRAPAPAGPGTQDLRGLSWCAIEIRHSLDAVDAALERYREAGDDASLLSAARAQIHQTLGVLNLLGLAGPDLVCAELEAVIDRVLAGEIRLDGATSSALSAAMAAICEYLDERLRGIPPQPLHLYPYLRDLQTARRAERIHPADLFFPAAGRLALAREPLGALSPEEAARVRQRFELGLLRMLRTPADASAARDMLAAIDRVARSPIAAGQQTFWALTAIYFRALADGHGALDVYGKRLLARLNLQLRRALSDGAPASERLQRDTLFSIACLRPNNDELRRVFGIFGLDGMVPENLDTPRYGQVDRRARHSVAQAITAMKKSWEAMLQNPGGVEAHVGEFKQALARYQEATDEFDPDGLGRLTGAWISVVKAIGLDSAPVSELLGVEMAVSLLFVEQLLASGMVEFPHRQARCAEIARRLDACLHGLGTEDALPDWLTDLTAAVQERLTMDVFVAESQANLRETEAALDAWFRRPEEGVEQLTAAAARVEAVGGTMKLLGHDDAAAGAFEIGAVARAIAAGEQPSDAVAASLAETVGNLGFFVDGLSTSSDAADAYVFDTTRRVLCRRDQSAADTLADVELTAKVARPELTLEARLEVELQSLDDALARAGSGEAAALADALQILATVHDTAKLADSADLADAAQVAGLLLEENGASALIQVARMLGRDVAELAAAPEEVAADLPEAAAQIDAELLEVFLIEGAEVLTSIGSNRTKLARSGSDMAALTSVRRGFHTLKGSSRMVGLDDFGDVAWALEELLNQWLAEERSVDDVLLALIDEAQGGFQTWIDALSAAGGGQVTHDMRSVVARANQLRQGRLESVPDVTSAPVSAKPAPADEVHAEAGPVAVAPISTVDEAGSAQAEPALPAEILPEAAFGSLPEAPVADPSRASLPTIDFDLEFGEPIELTSPGSGPEPAPGNDPDALWQAPLGVDGGQGTVEQAGEALPPASGQVAAPDEPARVFGLVAPEDVVETFELEAPEDFVESFARAAPADTVESFELTAPVDTVESFETAVPEDVVAPCEPALPRDEVATFGLELAETVAETPADAPAIAARDDVVENVDLALPGDAGGSLEVTGPDALAASVDARTEQDSDDDTIVVGGRRISASLFQVFAAEVDELQARLMQDARDWQHNQKRQASEFALRAVHSLKGSAALVGADAQSRLAGLLERALQSQAGSGRPASGEDLASYGMLLQTLVGSLRQVARREQPQSIDAVIGTAEALAARWAEQRAEPKDAAGAPAVGPVRPAQDEAPELRDEIDHELLPLFVEEASEYLPQIDGNLRAWLDQPGDKSLQQLIMRQLHTVKGSARMAGVMILGQRVHEMESRVETAMDEASIDPSMIEALMSELDQVTEDFERLIGLGSGSGGETDAYADAVSGEADVPAPAGASLVADSQSMSSRATDDGVSAGHGGHDSTAQPAAPESGEAPVAESAPVAVERRQAPRPEPLSSANAPIDPTPDAGAITATASGAEAPRGGNQAMVRVRAELLDALVNESGEASIARSRLDSAIGSVRIAMGDLAENVNRLRQQLREIEMHAETRIQANREPVGGANGPAGFDPLEFDRFTRFQELTRMLAESVNDVATVQHNAARCLDDAATDLNRQGLTLRQLQHDLLSVRMVQFGTINDRLYRVVRQSAKALGKRVALDVRGAGVHTDRGVLERMVAPLEHLLRNAIAHGIESPEQRSSAGKNEVGEIVVEVKQNGNEVVITLSDDGGGLDLTRIRQRALERGLIRDGVPISDEALADLIFRPGFSTAQVVDQISGRGVGMDVVRTEVSTLGGRIEVMSEAGRGSRFELHLPITMALAQVVMVSVGALRYAVSAASVETLMQLGPTELAQAYAERSIEVDGRRVPLYYLATLVDESSLKPSAQHVSPVMLVRTGTGRIAVHADSVSQAHEVVVKAVGPQVARIGGVAGATVLGNGEILLILNLGQLAREVNDSVQDAAMRAGMEARLEDAPATIMVVDDSVTVRKVTQRLLNRLGYDVVLAKDGVDALRQLQERVPDAMLLDIEMPRMDGFDLTRTLRKDERFARLPIVMITSRTADKHRNHALSLGVDAFLGKPYAEAELTGLLTQLTARRAGGGH
ncbi:MAG: Hpt domain-containing protein [Burkholderiaceae bacterium]